MAGFGFIADVDLLSDPIIIATSQNYILLLHNNQLLTTEEVTKWKKKHMIYGLRSVTSKISQDKKVSKIQHHKKTLEEIVLISVQLVGHPRPSTEGNYS